MTAQQKSSNGNKQFGLNLGALIAFLAIVVAIIGWMNTRVMACEQQVSSLATQTAVTNTRLSNIECLLSEVRSDTKQLREERQPR